MRVCLSWWPRRRAENRWISEAGRIHFTVLLKYETVEAISRICLSHNTRVCILQGMGSWSVCVYVSFPTLQTLIQRQHLKRELTLARANKQTKRKEFADMASPIKPSGCGAAAEGGRRENNGGTFLFYLFSSSQRNRRPPPDAFKNMSPAGGGGAKRRIITASFSLFPVRAVMLTKLRVCVCSIAGNAISLLVFAFSQASAFFFFWGPPFPLLQSAHSDPRIASSQKH